MLLPTRTNDFSEHQFKFFCSESKLNSKILGFFEKIAEIFLLNFSFCVQLYSLS